MTMTWSDEDRAWASGRGVGLEELEHQVRIATGGAKNPHLTSPCVPGHGIEPLDETLSEAGEALLRGAVSADRVSFFVPASGAASRMFKSVVQARHAGFEDESALAVAIQGEHPKLKSALDAFQGRGQLAAGQSVAEASLGDTLRYWVDELGLARMPKGLVPFHLYGGMSRTAAEEQVWEAADVVGYEARTLPLHFTVPDGQQDAFRSAVADVAGALSQRSTPLALKVSLSVQRPETDTVALTPEGEIFRLEDGTPLMRPGGHGALLVNLNDLQGDIVLIKNIDNIVRTEQRAEVVAWRRALLARLLDLEAQVRVHWRALTQGHGAEAALAFAEENFGVRSQEGDLIERAKNALGRPLRVCGVVRNEGQPGGGPFWVKGGDGSLTPQIVESAQMDLTDPAQRTAFEGATHFNPVDIVASLRDPNGDPYDLARFVDQEAWILASKTHEGRPLRALERPGLWNGSMAGWNTVFAEIPSQVFRPVKELADLLKSGHAAF